MLHRRGFLGVSAGAALAAAGAKAQAAAPFSAPLQPVRAQPGRAIRTVVGLRPYRPGGFRIAAERHGRRTLVHNYGHGGCGITLSWGSAALALEKAAGADHRRAAVVGAGVIGLTTAHLLLRRGFEVTVYADALPPATTSNIAAAFWQPTTLFRRSAVDEAFLRDFRRAARLSHRAFQHLANDPRYGVYWIRFFQFADNERRDAEPAFEGDDLYPGKTRLTDPAATFGFAEALRFHSMMIDPDIFLRALMNDIETAGGRIRTRRFETADDIFDLDEKLIFNCTGLGAGALFGDETMRPARGQLTMLLPQPEIDYGYVYPSPDGLLYMFPRRGAIVLGGTVKHGDWSIDIDESQRLRMLAGHARIAVSIAG